MEILKGLFIVLEGIDGSGKTTQAERLSNVFKKRKIDFISTFEPTKESEHGKRIRESFATSKRLSSHDEFTCFIKDREWHCENVIRPALDENKIVICDRYWPSTFVYQGKQGFYPEDRMEKILNPPIRPNIVFYYDISPVLAISRLQKSREKLTYFESLEFLRVIRFNYLDLASKHGFDVIYSADPIEEITEHCLNIIDNFININHIEIKKIS